MDWIDWFKDGLNSIYSSSRLVRVGTPSMVYNGHHKFQNSVSLGIPLYGSRNLAYIACKMDYYVSVINHTGCISHHGRLKENVEGLPDVPGPVAALQVGAGELKVVVDGPHVLVGATRCSVQQVFALQSLSDIVTITL